MNLVEGKNSNGEMTATIVTLPLGNLVIMLSGHIDFWEGVKKTVVLREGERCWDESTEGNNVRFQKWLV